MDVSIPPGGFSRAYLKLVAALGIVFLQAAHAEAASAIAFDSTTGNYGYAGNRVTVAEAEQDAIVNCGTPGAAIVRSGTEKGIWAFWINQPTQQALEVGYPNVKVMGVGISPDTKNGLNEAQGLAQTDCLNKGGNQACMNGPQYWIETVGGRGKAENSVALEDWTQDKYPYGFPAVPRGSHGRYNLDWTTSNRLSGRVLYMKTVLAEVGGRVQWEQDAEIPLGIIDKSRLKYGRGGNDTKYFGVNVYGLGGRTFKWRESDMDSVNPTGTSNHCECRFSTEGRALAFIAVCRGEDGFASSSTAQSEKSLDTPVSSLSTEPLSGHGNASTLNSPQMSGNPPPPPASARSSTNSPPPAERAASAETQLTNAYATARVHLNSTQRERLKQDEVKWIKKKDSYPEEDSRRAELIEQRVQELNAMANNSTEPESGSTSSPSDLINTNLADRTVAAEKKLGEVYTRLRASLDARHKDTLKREEIRWIKRKDAVPANDPSHLGLIESRIHELEHWSD